MQLGEIQQKWGQEDWGACEWQAEIVQAVGPDAQCHRFGGWGHTQRERPTRSGKAKGKGKDSGKSKGKDSGFKAEFLGPQCLRSQRLSGHMMVVRPGRAQPARISKEPLLTNALEAEPAQVGSNPFDVFVVVEERVEFASERFKAYAEAEAQSEGEELHRRELEHGSQEVGASQDGWMIWKQV